MVALMVCSLLAAGQPPADPPKPATVLDAASKLMVFEAKPDDLQTALANHPDVQIAEAKLRIAQAELAKVKLTVAQQVTAARANVSKVRAEAERAEQDLVRVKKLADAKTASAAEVQAVAALREQTKANLAIAEAELRTVAGNSPTISVQTPGVAWVELVNSDAGVNGVFAANERRVTFRSTDAPTGTVADKLRAALNRPVAFKAALENVTAESALAALKEAGHLDFVIKWGPDVGRNPPPVLTLPAGERSLAAWFDLLADEYDQAAGRNPPLRPTPYVREYGLLVAGADSKPLGAVSLAEFAKQKSAKSEPAVPAELRDRLRTALAKTINRAEMKVPPAVFFKELFAATGPELVVQSHLSDEPITIPGGEKTVLAWLEQIQDRWNGGLKLSARCEYFVRDYGLLLCPPADAPAGAVPLNQVK